jgi:transmembrane sensor
MSGRTPESGRTPQSERASEDAARWLLRLEEASASADTFVTWQRWLSAAPENKNAFDEIEEVVMILDRADLASSLPSAAEMAADAYTGSVPVSDFLARRRPSEEEFEEEKEAVASARPNASWSPLRQGARRRSSVTKPRYATAAGLIAVAVAGALLSFGALRQWRQGHFAYSTAPGERKEFTLRDGSRVTLDADSALNVDFTPGHRSLRLARGEAFFQVAKDPARPFVVSASGTRVRAIGTEFDVRIGDRRMVVAVVEGAVQLTSPATARPPSDSGAPGIETHLTGFGGGDAQPPDGRDGPPVDPSTETATRITAGQAVAYADDKGVERLSNSDSSSLATAWLGGRRQYRNEPLKDVLADVDRYTGKHIEVANTATGELQFTGTLDLNNSDAWLRALSIALPVTITRKPNGVLLVSLNDSQKASLPSD